MNSHIRGPAATGQGALVGQRGLLLGFASPAGTTLILQVSNPLAATKPVRVDLTFLTDTAFNGNGAAVSITRTKASDSSTSTVLTGTMTAGANTNNSLLAYDGDMFNVVFVPGTGATTGVGVAFARVAGSGQL